MHAQQNGSAKKYLLYHNILILNKFKNQTVKDQLYNKIGIELTNEQWRRIEPIIVSSIPSKNHRGRSARNLREVLNGIL
jgi:hypothetical protein